MPQGYTHDTHYTIQNGLFRAADPRCVVSPLRLGTRRRGEAGHGETSTASLWWDCRHLRLTGHRTGPRLDSDNGLHQASAAEDRGLG